jgi:hypothetical protein
MCNVHLRAREQDHPLRRRAGNTPHELSVRTLAEDSLRLWRAALESSALLFPAANHEDFRSRFFFVAFRRLNCGCCVFLEL